MTSSLGSHKMEISGSLKYVESQQENLGPSPFQIAHNKKLWYAPQTQNKARNGSGLKNPKLPHFTVSQDVPCACPKRYLIKIGNS